MPQVSKKYKNMNVIGAFCLLKSIFYCFSCISVWTDCTFYAIKFYYKEVMVKKIMCVHVELRDNI